MLRYLKNSILRMQSWWGTRPVVAKLRVTWAATAPTCFQSGTDQCGAAAHAENREEPDRPALIGF